MVKRRHNKPNPDYVASFLFAAMQFSHALAADSYEEGEASGKQTAQKISAVWDELRDGKSTDTAGARQLCREVLAYCIRVLED